MKSRILWCVPGTARFHSPAIVTQLSLIVSLVLVLFAASASAAPLVYVVTASQQFGTVDLATGHFQPIGNSTPDGMGNLVWWHGSLLSLTTTGADVGSLAKINPATGEVTDIGPTGLGFKAFDLAEIRGKLYLTDFSNNIYSVDPETGIATKLGATGMPPDPNTPLTFNTDDGTFNLCDEGLYSMGGKLYATFDSFAIDPTQNPPTRAHEYVSPALYQIDPFSGRATFIAPTDWQLSALVEVDGKFYAFRNVIDGFDFTFNFPLAHAELVTLNLDTGKTNKLTDIDDHSVGPIFGAAPVRSSRPASQ
jgi:hypothetical protein